MQKNAGVWGDSVEESEMHWRGDPSTWSKELAEDTELRCARHRKAEYTRSSYTNVTPFP